ncbi:MAG TPA: hypothetical protein VF230_07110 [Acidimicrobiales bacterium]
MSHRRAALVLLTVEAALALAFAVHTALSFQRDLSPIDEAAHLSYVQLLAEEHRLPVLGRDQVTLEAYALWNDLDPERTAVPDLTAGLGAHSYEAFQPPAYFVLAAVVHAVTPGSYDARFVAVRLLGVALAAVSFGLVVTLAWLVSREWWPAIATVACSVFLMPGLVVRLVTVSNSALEPLVATALVCAAVAAIRRRSPAFAAATLVLLAVAVLTKLSLVALAPVALIALVAVLRADRGRAAVVRLAAGCVVALVLVAPWFAWNRSTYGAWTANDRAKALQGYIVNPDGHDYTASNVVGSVPDTLLVAHAQETSGNLAQPYTGLVWFVAAALIAVPAVVASRGVASASVLAVLALPLVSSLVLFAAVTVVEDWPTMVPRYLWPVLPAWGVLAGAAYLGEPSPRSARVALRVAVALAATGVTLSLWSFDAPSWRG